MRNLFSCRFRSDQSRRRRPSYRRELRRRGLRQENLEQRWVLATVTVGTIVDEADGSIDDGDVSLRDAIALANAGDTIDFDASLDGGTILLTLGELAVTRSMTIDATALTVGLTIDASGNDPTPDEHNGDGSRVFNIDDGDDDTDSPVTVRGLSLTGGDPGVNAGAIQSRETLTVTNCTISGNSRAGILAIGGEEVRVTNSMISGNSASGILGDLREVTVTNSTISGNTVMSDTFFGAARRRNSRGPRNGHQQHDLGKLGGRRRRGHLQQSSWRFYHN